MLNGSMLIVLATILQGSFALPMTRTRGLAGGSTRRWRFRYGLFLFNWALAFAAMPNATDALAASRIRDLVILIAFGAQWGVGAILLGRSMRNAGLRTCPWRFQSLLSGNL
jgi:hypothetical protein